MRAAGGDARSAEGHGHLLNAAEPPMAQAETNPATAEEDQEQEPAAKRTKLADEPTEPKAAQPVSAAAPAALPQPRGSPRRGPPGPGTWSWNATTGDWEPDPDAPVLDPAQSQPRMPRNAPTEQGAAAATGGAAAAAAAPVHLSYKDEQVRPLIYTFRLISAVGELLLWSNQAGVEKTSHTKYPGVKAGEMSVHGVIAEHFQRCKPGEYAPAAPLLQRYSWYAHQSRGVLDIPAEMAAVTPVTYEAVLAALEYIDFPENPNRKNVKQNADDRMESMCYGLVLSWARRSSYGWGGVSTRLHRHRFPGRSMREIAAVFSGRWRREWHHLQQPHAGEAESVPAAGALR